jgi:hypothetical protein
MVTFKHSAIHWSVAGAKLKVISFSWRARNLLAVSELPRTEKPPNRKVRLVEASQKIEFEEFSI